MIHLRRQADETLKDVSHASRKVAETTEWAGIAVLVVGGVAILALALAVLALERSSYDR